MQGVVFWQLMFVTEDAGDRRGKTRYLSYWLSWIWWLIPGIVPDCHEVADESPGVLPVLQDHLFYRSSRAVNDGREKNTVTTREYLKCLEENASHSGTQLEERIPREIHNKITMLFVVWRLLLAVHKLGMAPRYIVH